MDTKVSVILSINGNCGRIPQFRNCLSYVGGRWVATKASRASTKISSVGGNCGMGVYQSLELRMWLRYQWSRIPRFLYLRDFQDRNSAMPFCLMRRATGRKCPNPVPVEKDLLNAHLRGNLSLFFSRLRKGEIRISYIFCSKQGGESANMLKTILLGMQRRIFQIWAEMHFFVLKTAGES